MLIKNFAQVFSTGLSKTSDFKIGLVNPLQRGTILVNSRALIIQLKNNYITMKSIITFLLLSVSILVYSQDLAKISTTHGDIILKLYEDTPKHRENFLKLVSEDYYDGQLFHRVIKNFMIQGGDPNSKNSDKGEMLGMGGPEYTLPAEFRANHYHKKGALAAARKGDAVNPEKRSSGSQFYIVQGQVLTANQLEAFVSMGRHAPFTPEQIADYTTLGGSPHLDGEYTVFGEVVEGFEVIDRIASMPVDSYNRPLEDIKYTIEIIRK